MNISCCRFNGYPYPKQLLLENDGGGFVWGKCSAIFSSLRLSLVKKFDACCVLWMNSNEKINQQ